MKVETAGVELEAEVVQKPPRGALCVLDESLVGHLVVVEPKRPPVRHERVVAVYHLRGGVEVGGVVDVQPPRVYRQRQIQRVAGDLDKPCLREQQCNRPEVGVVLVVLDGDVRALVAVGVSLFAGVIVYSAIFTWAGLVTTRALAFALVYVFLWEGLVSTYLGGVRYLSVRGYTLGIMHGIDGTNFESLDDRVIQFPAAIAGACVVTVIFFLLTVRRLRNMDVP